MREVVLAGVGMTRFGKFLDRGLKSLTAEAVEAALNDAGASEDAIEWIYFANVAAGLLQGQESTRGQQAMKETGLHGIPLVNVENACASGSTAVHQAWLSVASGAVDVALAVGVEKLYHADPAKTFAAFSSAIDQDHYDEIAGDLGTAPGRSIFMDIYARWATDYMERTGATVEDFARVAVKNHRHGALNPNAQYGKVMTIEQVLSAQPICGPLTLPMCSPVGDGAAAAVLTTPEIARRWGASPVRILAIALGCGREGRYGELVPGTARKAFETAGIAPVDVDVIECHDATAPAELIVMEEIGVCSEGEAPKLIRAGDTTIGGRLPINPSGGLESKGHPVGATGIAQLVELADQLRGRCGGRQVEGARIGLAENAGGYLGPDTAVASVTILGA